MGWTRQRVPSQDAAKAAEPDAVKYQPDAKHLSAAGQDTPDRVLPRAVFGGRGICCSRQ
jgi:hypothetical protein